jgi:hypothetical protein
VPRLTTLVTVRSCSSLVLPTATTCKGQSFEQKLSKIEEQFLQLTVKVSFENFERGLPRIVVRRLQNAVAKVPNRIRLPERELESRRQEFFGGLNGRTDTLTSHHVWFSSQKTTTLHSTPPHERTQRSTR